MTFIEKLAEHKTFHTFIWSVLCTLFLQTPALRAYDKYLPEALHSFYLLMPAFFFGFYLLIQQQKPCLQKLLNSQWLFISLCLIYTVAIFFAHPIADGLKEVGRGSDDDDAFKMIAMHYLSLSNPYLERTFPFNNPLSTGAGWVLLWSPIVWLKAYHLINPIMLAFTGWSIHKIITPCRWIVPNLFILLVLSSLIIWETGASGTDLISLGLCLTSFLIWIQKINKTYLFILMAMIFGLIANSRVVFLYLPFLMGFILWAQGKSLNKAFLFSVISFITALGFHAIFYIITPEGYPPMHILGKGESIMPDNFKIISLIVCALVGVYMLFNKKRLQPYTLFLLGFATPLCLLSLSELIYARTFDFKMWDGARYFIPSIPLFALIASQEIFKRNQRT